MYVLHNVKPPTSSMWMQTISTNTSAASLSFGNVLIWEVEDRQGQGTSLL